MAFVVLAAGCARVQRLVVTTNPPGAVVTLIKKGRVENKAGIAGVGGLQLNGSYEDPPMELGASPVTYEFPEVEDSAVVAVPGLFAAQQRKICTEMVIRATYRDHFAERQVPVRYDRAEVNMVLTERVPSSRPASTSFPALPQ